MPGPFLIGGGREPGQVLPTHRPFVDACAGGPIVALVADDGEGVDEERWHEALTESGAEQPRIVVISRERPPAAGDLAGVAGVYVAGGLTPLYAELLAGLVIPPGVVYAGFSAGAAIAAERAIVGGWRAGRDGCAICPEDTGEDLEGLTIVDGLGLVPYAIDIHAAQWGTLGRLVHAVQCGLVGEGWALDEGAVLVDAEVHGPGAAWHVARDGRVRRVTSS